MNEGGDEKKETLKGLAIAVGMQATSFGHGIMSRK